MSTVSGEPADWNRVADSINERMRELGWDQADLVRRAGLSDATVRQLQRGEKPLYRRSSLRKVSVALLWPPDGIERLAGGATVEDLGRQMAATADAADQEAWRDVAARVAARRDDVGLSQVDLALRAGVDVATVRALESGDRRPYHIGELARVAGALDWPADAVYQLVAGIPEPRRNSDLIEPVTSERISDVEERLTKLEGLVRRVLAANGLEAE